MAAVPAAVASACMWDAGTYDEAEVEANWDEIVKIYGSEELAAKAVTQVRGIVMCPLYSNPIRLRESYTALVDLMGDESKEILDMHPAILTCGDEVRNADKDEVRRLAKAREVADKLSPELIIGGIATIVAIGIFKFIQVKSMGGPGADAFPSF